MNPQTFGPDAFSRMDALLGSRKPGSDILRESLPIFLQTLNADAAAVLYNGPPRSHLIACLRTGAIADDDVAPWCQRHDLGYCHPLGAGKQPKDGNTVAVAAMAGAHEVILYLERNEPETAPFVAPEITCAEVLLGFLASHITLPTEDERESLFHGIALADVITQDRAMLRLLELVRRIGDTDLMVLLQGETGTGKKILAQAIHRASQRRQRPFVTVDCAGIPESLVEAELFGWVRGAFTGAVRDRTGILEEAESGTLFIDDIEKASVSLQRRFLHLLDSAEIRPVGADTYRRVDVRVICATSSSNLLNDVEDGGFLKDLYYRLNDVVLSVPPLRDRRDDVLLLAGCFVETNASRTGRRIRGMSAAFRRALLAYEWPGNVRELEKAIRTAVSLADDDVLLTPDLLPDAVRGRRESIEGAGLDLRGRVENLERHLICDMLLQTGWNKSRCARELGLSREGLRRKMERYRIRPDGYHQ